MLLASSPYIDLPPVALVAQRLVAAWFLLTASGQLWITAWCLYHLRNVYFTSALALYLAYALGPGSTACHRCTWPKWLRRLPIWGLLAEYFPASLVKTEDLDPNGNYMFVMHPHGIIAISAWINFATEATGFSRLFKGIDLYVCTLESNFRVPLLREYCLLHGLRSASKSAIRYILTSKPGRSVALVVGGAAEALVAAPATYDVVLDCRKGFVKLALEAGASLVPVIAFGETDLFDTYIPPPGSRTQEAFRRLKRVFGFSTPVCWGTGLIGGWGLLPYQKPLTTVVGKPLHCPKYTGPSDSPELHALVEKYHTQYVEALQQLWNSHKSAHAPCRRRSLHIVE